MYHLYILTLNGLEPSSFGPWQTWPEVRLVQALLQKNNISSEIRKG